MNWWRAAAICTSTPNWRFEEVRTAGIVAEELNGLGLEVQTGVGKTGVVGHPGRRSRWPDRSVPGGYGCAAYPRGK